MVGIVGQCCSVHYTHSEIRFTPLATMAPHSVQFFSGEGKGEGRREGKGGRGELAITGLGKLLSCSDGMPKYLIN